jgi:hypothetical protein
VVVHLLGNRRVVVEHTMIAAHERPTVLREHTAVLRLLLLLHAEVVLLVVVLLVVLVVLVLMLVLVGQHVVE